MEVVVSYNASWFHQRSASIPKHQHRDEHRLSHRKSSALWENAGWECEEVGHAAPLSWHKMQALPCRTCGFKGSTGPFIIALLFLSLAGLLDRTEAPGADVTSSSASGPRDFNTFVFSAISVK